MAHKRVLLAVLSVLFIGLATFLLWKRDLAVRLNYNVTPSGFIILTRPDMPDRQARLLSLFFLPMDCWNDVPYAPGEWGRISWEGRTTCRAERYTRWDPEQTARHYVEIEKGE